MSHQTDTNNNASSRFIYAVIYGFLSLVLFFIELWKSGLYIALKNASYACVAIFNIYLGIMCVQFLLRETGMGLRKIILLIFIGLIVSIIESVFVLKSSIEGGFYIFTGGLVVGLVIAGLVRIFR